MSATEKPVDNGVNNATTSPLRIDFNPVPLI